MNILVTGGHGYIGSLLVPELIKEGHKVSIMDTMWFGENIVPSKALEANWNMDIRDIPKNWLAGIDSVIHLAGISNDPSADFRPDINYSINAGGTATLAQAAREAGVKKFIYASTCSVYGYTGTGKISIETDKPSPKYPYGISKLMAEIALQALAEKDFKIVILRKGTVGGAAPRMRLDLLVNTMTKTALQTGKIVSKHSYLWRPVIDIRDVAKAYQLALNDNIEGIFNIVGQNYNIYQVAEQVQEAMREEGFDVKVDKQEFEDLRNYKASGDKALKVMDFSAKYSIRDTVKSILKRVEGEDLNDKKFYNIKVCEEILK